MDISELYEYYADALDFLFRKGSEFGRKYPKVASTLEMGEHNIGDPGVRKLIESFALYDARINHGIDQHKEKLAAFLLQFTYPELCYPSPCATIVRLECEKLVNVPSGSRFHLKNKEQFPCDFRTCMNVSVTESKVMDLSYTSTQMDQKLQHYWFDACFLLKLRLVGTDKLTIYLNSDSAPQILHSMFTCAIESDPKIYDYNTGDEVGKITMVVPELTESSLLGDPYIHMHEYSILPQAFHFIQLCFKVDSAKKKENNVRELTCVIPMKNLPNRYMIHDELFLLNCVPCVNLFMKRSEPVKFTVAKECIELIPGLNTDDTKVQKLTNMYVYDPSKGKETQVSVGQRAYYPLVSHDLNKVEVFLTQPAKAKLGEYMLIFGELLCSNGKKAESIEEGTVGYLENMNYVTARSIVSLTKFGPIRELDKWLVLSLLETNQLNKHISTDSLLQFCNKIMSLYEIPHSSHLFESIRYYEDLGTLDNSRSWRTVVSKGVFEIRLDDNQPEAFLLANIWARIFQSLHHLHLLVETRLVSRSGAVLKVISDGNS